MGRKLKNISLQEISMVDKPASKKQFLFFKQEGKPAPAKKLKKKINIVIDSDGTVGGTKIQANGDTLGKLRDFSFSFYRGDEIGSPVSCSYSTLVETDDGFSRAETFYLSKGDLIMDEEIKKQLDEYFGEDAEVDFEKAEENTAVVEALVTVNEYREELPDDLKKAVGTIAKQAALYHPSAPEKKEKDTIKKAGAKLSKDTRDKLEAAMAALESLKSILPTAEKSDENDEGDLKKKIADLTKSITDIEKKKDETTKEELTQTLDSLTARLKKVEETTGVKKSVVGQDDSTDDGTKKLWPSIS